jgi:hypothetical protein
MYSHVRRTLRRGEDEARYGAGPARVVVDSAVRRDARQEGEVVRCELARHRAAGGFVEGDWAGGGEQGEGARGCWDGSGHD